MAKGTFNNPMTRKLEEQAKEQAKKQDKSDNKNSNPLSQGRGPIRVDDDKKSDSKSNSNTKPKSNTEAKNEEKTKPKERTTPSGTDIQLTDAQWDVLLGKKDEEIAKKTESFREKQKKREEEKRKKREEEKAKGITPGSKKSEKTAKDKYWDEHMKLGRVNPNEVLLMGKGPVKIDKLSIRKDNFQTKTNLGERAGLDLVDKAVNNYVSVVEREHTFTEEENARKAIDDSILQFKKVSPEGYEKHRQAIDYSVKYALDKDYRTGVRGHNNLGFSVQKYAESTEKGDTKSAEAAKQAAWADVQNIKKNAPKYYAENAATLITMYAGTLSADEIEKILSESGESVYNAIWTPELQAEYENASKVAMEAYKKTNSAYYDSASKKEYTSSYLKDANLNANDGVKYEPTAEENAATKRLSQLAQIRSNADAAKKNVEYDLSRIRDIAVYTDAYGRGWIAPEIDLEKVDKKVISKITKDILYNVAYQDNPTAAPEMLSNSESYKNAQNGESTVIDLKAAFNLSKIDEIKDSESFNNHLARLVIMYEQGDKLNSPKSGKSIFGRYRDDFLVSEAAAISRKKYVDEYADVMKNGSGFQKFGKMYEGFSTSLFLTPYALGEGLVAVTTAPDIDGYKINTDYGLYSSNKGGIDEGRTTLGISMASNTFGNEDVGRFVFNLGDGIATNFANGLTGPGNMFFSGMQVLQSEIDAGIQNKENVSEFFPKAVIAAGAESIGELVQFKGLERVLDTLSTEKNFFKRVFKGVTLSGANEVPSELTTEAINIISDILISGEDSEYNRSILEMIASGEASGEYEAALKYFGKRGFDTAVTAYLSGAFLGGSSSVFSYDKNSTKSLEDLGSRIKNGEGNVNILIEQAKTSKNKGTVSLANKKNHSALDIGKLYNMALADTQNGDLDLESFATGQMYLEAARKIKSEGRVEDLIEVAKLSSNSQTIYLAEAVEEHLEGGGRTGDANVAKLYQAVATDLTIEAEKIAAFGRGEKVIPNVETAAESALENAIADVAKTNSAESGKLEATKADTAKRTIPLDDKKPKVTVATKDGGSVTVNGREFVTINGRGIYIVEGSQLGASQKYYAVDASTGKAIAASDTNKKLTNAVYDFMTEMKKPDSYIKDDIDSFEEYIDVASDIAVDKVETGVKVADSGDNVEVVEIDSPVEVSETAKKSGDEKIVVPEKKVDKVTYERAFTERKTTAVSESELSGDDVEVGKTITHSDLTQAVIDQALNSNDAATIKAAKDIQRRVYKNTDEMYRAVGRLAKAVGITGNDVIQSRAASIAQRYNDSNFGSTYTEFSNDLRQKFELAGDEIGIQALDYLDSIQAKSGQTGIDTVATDGIEYSDSNRNRVVENYISGIQYAFRANGNKNTRFEVYYDDSEGAKRGEWKVDRKGNVTIRINGAKVRGAESATWVLTHELFHGAAKNNPGIVDRVIDTFREIGIYDDSKFDAYKAEYEAAEGKELTDDYIKEEIAADLMMDVMGNEELTAMFAQKSTKEDLNFIARFFRRFVDAIKKVFDGNKKYQQYVYDAEKLLGVFERAIKSEANADVKRISSNELDTRYSLIYSGDIAKGQINYVENKKSYITEAELKDAQEVTRAMVDVMMKYSEILPEDKIGKVLTKNGSYDRSVENTTICVRTLAYNEFVDKVQEEIGRPLTQMESFLVSQKLYDIATEPQCLYCYVSLDRKAFNDMLLRYMQDRDTVIAKYNNSDKSPKAVTELYKEFLHGRKDTKEMKTRFDKWIGYVDNGTKLLSLADIATDANQKEIQSKGGNLAEQLKDARQYAQSASWSKIQKNYVAYRDEILKLGDRVVKNLNEHYGLRWYSFSDYSAAFIVENMQQITDASIRGLKGLAYTKDTDFVEIFAPTGMNINVSVFVNQDADGNFFIDEKQSANFEKAVELRKKYPNVGIVATVTNDEALRWAGEQEWSDVIIPFHIVRTGTDVAEYYKWLNYTGESGDTIADKNLWDAYVDSLNLSSENARKKVSKNIYPSEHKNNKDTYLSLCESRGLSPRFVRFAGEAWYMKLVNETRLSADDSSSLKPEFNLDAAKDSFQKFIDKGGYKGGWYKEGVDVDAEAKTVADDVLAGKKANEVEYGRQDGFVPEDIIAKRKSNRTHGKSASTDVETKSAVTSTPANENSVFDDKQRKDVIRKLSAVAKQNGVARLDKDSFVTDAMGILEGALQTGIVSDGVVGELARCLYEYSREDAGDADLAGTYKDIRERVNKVGKIYVPESVKNDIPDYDTFRKQFGTLLTTKDETALEVDKLYNDLKMDYPDIFTEDLVAGDQLQKLADVLAEARKYKANDGLTHTSEIHSFDDVKTDFVEMADEMLDDISASVGIELVEESDVYAELAESGKDISSIEIPNELIMKDKLSDKQIQALLQKVKNRRNEYMYVQKGSEGSRRVKKHPNADKEYNFLQRLFAAETGYKDAQKRLRDAEKKAKSKDAEVDNKRLTDFTKGIANAFGFGGDTSKTADVGRGLKGLYDAVSEYIKTGDDAALDRMFDSVGSVAKKVAGYSTSDVDIDKVGGYILDSFSNVAKGAKGDVTVASANDIASLENGTMAALEGVQSVAEADYSGEVEAARKALYDATAKLRAQQVQPYFETVMDKFFDMQEAEIAAAEAKFDKALAEEKAKGKEAVAEAREKSDKKLAEERTKRREEVAEVRKRSKERVKKMREKAAQAREENSEKRNRKKQEKKLLETVRELFRTKTTIATAEDIKKAFGMLDTKAINMSAKTREELQSQAYEYYKNLKENFDSETANSNDAQTAAIKKRIGRLDLKQIGNLTNNELATLLENAIAMKHYIANQKFIIKDERRAMVNNAAKSAVNAIRSVEATNAKVDKKTGNIKAKEIRDGKIKGFLRNENSARTNFRRWFGYDDNSAFMELVYGLERGETQYNTYKVRWLGMFDSLLNEDNKDALRNFTGTKAKPVEVKLTNGKKINVPEAMLVSIAANAKNADFIRHVEYGGIEIPNVGKYYSKKSDDVWRNAQIVKLTKQDLAIISEYVENGEYTKQWLDTIRKLYKNTGEAINATSRLLEGIDRAKVEFYFPLSVSSGYKNGEIDVPTHDVSLEDMSMLKERKGSIEPIRLEDCTRVVNRSIEDSARYAGLAVPVRNFSMTYNAKVERDGKKLKQVIHDTYGQSANQYIEELIQKMSRRTKAKYDDFEKLSMKFTKGLAKSAMALNFRVATGNFGGLGVAEGVLGSKAMKAGLTLKNAADEETINKFTPYLAVRKAGGTSVEMSDIGRMNDLTKTNKGFALAYGTMNAVDEKCTKMIWNASEAYIRQNNKELEVGTDEYYKAVAKVFNETILRTQPTDTVFDTPALIRSDSVFAKVFTQFKSALMKYQTFLVDSTSEFSYRAKEAGGTKEALKALKNGTNKELEEAFKKFSRAQAGYLKSAIIVGVNELIWGLILHDIDFVDEEDEFTAESMLDGFMDMFIGSYTGGLVGLDETIDVSKIIADVVSKIENGEKVFDDYMYDLELPLLSVVNDTIGMIGNIPNVWEKLEKGQIGWRTAVKEFIVKPLKLVGNATGIPVNDIMRYTNDVFKTGYVATRFALSGGSQPVASYYRYKVDEDGNQYYTRQKMINKALEAMEAGDMDSYNAIRDDMIESKYASAETFDKELKKLQTSIELGKYGEVFTNVDKLATKAQNDFDRESTGEKAFRNETHNRDKNFAKNAIDAIENDETLSEKEKKAQIALVGEMIRGKDHTKTEGQKLAIRNYDEVGNKGIFDFNVWDKEYYIYVDGEKESVNLSAEDYIAYNTEFNDATEYLRLAIFGGEEAVKNHGVGIKEKYGSEPWMLLAEGLPKDATAAERAEFYIGATSKLENVIRASYTAKYFDDFEQDYSYLKESNPEKYAQVAENMSDIDSGKVATKNIFERELDGNSTYDREVFHRADDVIAKAEDLIEKLPKDKQASARKYLEDYIADFAFDRRKGGELLAKVFDEVYADTEVKNADDMYDLIDGIFDSWGEFASNRQYKDDKQYDADYSVEDFIKINSEMEDADELMRLVCFGEDADVKDEIEELKNKYKNAPWMLVINSAIDNAPSTAKEQLDFYKKLKNSVKQNIRLDYGYDYVKEISSGNKDIDNFLAKADAAYKAGSLYDNDFTGAAKGQKNYYARQQSFIENSLSLIDNNPLLSASQKKEQKDKLGEYVRGLRYSPTLGQKYIMAEFDDYAKSAEEYNKYIDAEISRTGDDTLDKMHWDSAEDSTKTKSHKNMPYLITYPQPQYAEMVGHMDKGEEYAALYIFGTNKELNAYKSTLTKDEQAWVAEGVSELSKEEKKIDRYIAKGILSKESKDAYMYYALVGKIKSAVRAHYRDTVFDTYKKYADTPKGYYVKYNP